MIGVRSFLLVDRQRSVKNTTDALSPRPKRKVYHVWIYEYLAKSLITGDKSADQNEGRRDAEEIEAAADDLKEIQEQNHG